MFLNEPTSPTQAALKSYQSFFPLQQFQKYTSLTCPCERTQHPHIYKLPFRHQTPHLLIHPS